ncbi:MAG: triple tyrosine motif-containing protein [Bacteroidetes bacterium]|nr:triple tyrosine motif-containing protein [Bacteroidota bacterium]
MAGKPVVKKAGHPKKVLLNTNIHPAGVLKSVKAGTPVICVPGKGKYSMPRKVPAIKNSVAAGIPEVVIAKEAHISSNSPYNLSSFGKFQGLKTNNIYCITQDHFGNIWLGTSGGITRYDGYSFTHYSSDEGLCNNNVLSILLDKNNNLWIGTAGGGVTKYDGKTFTNFSMKEGLSSDTVSSILEDKNGYIWFGTKGGASKYDGSSFTRYTKKEGLTDNHVVAICEDRGGNIWFGTDGGVSRYNGRSFSNFTVKEGLCSNGIRTILQDKTEKIWFGTDAGVSLYDGKCFTYFTGKNGLSNNPVNSVIEDRNNNIWFGTWGDGIYKYDGKFFTHYDEKEGLPKNEILCVFEGKGGIIWMGTMAGGVARYSGDSFEHFIVKEGTNRNRIQNIVKDKKGNLWFGTWGAGVSKYDGKSFTYYTKKEGLINNDVRSLLEDKKGNLWFGTMGGIAKFDGTRFTRYTEKEGLTSIAVISMLQDASGNLWFGTQEKGVTKYDGKHFFHYGKKEGLSGSTVRCMMQDKRGNIWFATNEGVTKYRPAGKSGTGQGSFTHYNETGGLPSNDVISILEDRHGNIWIGNSWGGVTKFDGKYFTYYTKKDGLCEDGVMSLMEDKSGNLWIGTRRGFNKLSKEQIGASSDDSAKRKGRQGKQFSTYCYEDGFFGIGCNANAMCEDNNGVIWIGANDRLTAFHPGEMITDTIPPNIQLTGVELFNEPIPWNILEKNKESRRVLNNGAVVNNVKFDGLSGWYNIPQNLSLAYDDNFLIFNFIGITTPSAQNVRYEYSLDGLGKKWVAFTDQMSASYGHLPDGTFTFRVRAMSRAGYWSNELKYTFTIRPPWWETTWAYFIYTLLFIGGIILVDRIQTDRVIERERKRTIDRELQQAHLIEMANHELQIQNGIVEKQRNELELQKRRSDNLLLNILPSEIAEELKAKDAVESKLIKEVTVLFTDFKEFTRFSERVSPRELVAEIHECFSAFDRIMEKNGIEKIKTIGDSYMAAGGLPTPNKTHAFNVIKAAEEIQQFMWERRIMKEARREHYLELRIGVNTGPVVAGVVGINKFAYDIWGDTVNIASHMEKSGAVGRVNVTRATYQYVKDKFECEYRGKSKTKNNKMIEMYFINFC